MHGVSKTALSDEQKETKRLERAKKQERFVKARDFILKKVSEEQYDDEGLKITGTVLSANPDLYIFWNYRKRAILSIEERNDPGLREYYRNELALTEDCLRDNPKSYGTWYHRQWILRRYFRSSEQPQDILRSELRHCGEALGYDERNFHCWDHRRFICQLASVPEENELKFSKEKIDENFSNYSAWHYRSSLLPNLFPPSERGSALLLEETKLKEELQYVCNAFFTDPEDQSAWFYHLWLFRPALENMDEKIRLKYYSFISAEPACIILSFNRAINIIESSSPIRLVINDSIVLDTNWQNPDGSRSCLIWTNYSLSDEMKGALARRDCLIKIFIGSELISAFRNASHGVCGRFQRFAISPDSIENYAASVLQPSLPAAFRVTLENSLNSCCELKEIEPTSNKWPTLTVILSVRSLDLLKYRSEILSGLDSLINVDHRKKNYYEDLKSRFIIEAQLLQKYGPGHAIELTKLSLDGLGLTSLPSLRTTSLMICVTELNLNNNRLRSTTLLGYLVNLVWLSLNGNLLEEINGIGNLRHLRYLSAASNKLASTYSDCLIPLQHCTNLKELILTGNPFCDNCTVTDLFVFLRLDKAVITL